MTTEMPPDVHEQIASVYLIMADQARYRPAAPSDGYGNITVPAPELDLDAEIRDYAAAWLQSEDNGSYWCGSPDYPLRKVMILCIEAARACAGGDRDLPKSLIAAALGELDDAGHGG
jgi:hypothetical protein